jgi:hypothetical protein
MKKAVTLLCLAVAILFHNGRYHGREHDGQEMLMENGKILIDSDDEGSCALMMKEKKVNGISLMSFLAKRGMPTQ